jgi:hypothetical protein
MGVWFLLNFCSATVIVQGLAYFHDGQVEHDTSPIQGEPIRFALGYVPDLANDRYQIVIRIEEAARMQYLGNCALP